MIFIVNSSGSTWSLFVNSGQIQAPDRMSPENGYRPFLKAVRLEKRDSEGVFGLGANRVEIRYRDFIPPLPSVAVFCPNIPDGSIRSDYVLVVFATGATLMRASGEDLEWFFWSGPPSAPTCLRPHDPPNKERDK